MYERKQPLGAQSTCNYFCEIPVYSMFIVYTCVFNVYICRNFCQMSYDVANVCQTYLGEFAIKHVYSSMIL